MMVDFLINVLSNKAQGFKNFYRAKKMKQTKKKEVGIFCFVILCEVKFFGLRSFVQTFYEYLFFFGWISFASPISFGLLEKVLKISRSFL
jgi:hypothetical protein